MWYHFLHNQRENVYKSDVGEIVCRVLRPPAFAAAELRLSPSRSLPPLFPSLVPRKLPNQNKVRRIGERRRFMRIENGAEQRFVQTILSVAFHYVR